MNEVGRLRDALAESAQQLGGEMAAFCADLVRVPSVNGRDPEANVVKVIERYGHQFGLDVRVSEAAPGRPTSVVSDANAGDLIADGGLLLVGHTDTVPEGEHATWHHDPFGAEVVGTRLYGRGACDNKGGIAAAFFALVVLQRHGLLARTHTALLCVPDEESGATGTLGIVPLLRTRGLRARGAIYTYPGLSTLPIGHRGVLRLSVTAHGEAIHSGSPEWQRKSRGANAVLAMADLLLELDRYDLNAGVAPLGPAWADLRGVLTAGTTIAGGAGPSIVPDRCVATIDIRLVPGQERERLLTSIRDVMAAVAVRHPHVNFELEVTAYAPATEIPVDTPIVRAVRQAAALVLPRPPTVEIAGPANEGYLLNAGGIPTICGFGPTGGQFHAPDEYVDLPSLPVAATIYALAALILDGQADM